MNEQHKQQTHTHTSEKKYTKRISVNGYFGTTIEEKTIDPENGEI